ncbi:B12-binding domain-containing radical SAM protein [Tepidanaerobacter syntrophicus]|uniref:B12-binding domain-containing radical SAM protein n=1 Tax=Tepidanaerobacter syntrophicus TaxID=224999 RepID=UPI001BD1CB5F
MKTLLVGINAKYIHTNLAIRDIFGYIKQNNKEEDIQIYEATINDELDDILEDIISYQPDVIGFSCYLWNIESVLYLAENIKKIRPETKIVLGGPEVSYEAENLLERNPFVDYVILGEGEERFFKLLLHLKSGALLDTIDGLAYKKWNDILIQSPKPYVNLNKIPFPYINENENLENKLVYYETSRGCPFRCAFCLSSLETAVREADLDKVEQDFMRFLRMGVRIVKLVDRSFNCNLPRALRLLEIIRSLPQDMIFHCEINPELVNEEFIEALQGIEDRLQFEVGIQSTNPETLKEISRAPNTKKSLDGIKRLKSAGIKLHVDLIAGLPHENFKSFGNSFNEVYNLHTDEIQLGFLKLLKGTKLRTDAHKYGIIYRSKPPYEILYNNDITYEELCILKGIARLLDKYYNTGRFYHSLIYLEEKFKCPFELYQAFYDYCKREGLFKTRHSLKDRYDILYYFAESLGTDIVNFDIFKDILKFDFLLTNGKAAMPRCIEACEDREFLTIAKKYIYNNKWLKENLPQAIGFSNHELSRYLAYGLFNYDIPYNYNVKKKKGVVFLQKNNKNYYADFEV